MNAGPVETAPIEATLDRYADLYENISGADIARLDEYFSSDARFKDPFNDVHGLDNIRHVFTRMFETCLAIDFTVTDRFVAGHTGCLIWHFRFTPNVAGYRNRTWTIDGASRIQFDANGKILEHIDFWDAGEYFYGRLPIIGGLIRFIKRRVG